MITGTVRSDEGRIRLSVVGINGRRLEVDAVVDTGYTGSLTLQRNLIASLGLRWRSAGRATLANGSQCVFDVYEASVIWDGAVRPVLIDEANTTPLVGMRLLRGHELLMQVRANGKIRIKRLA